MLNLAGADHVQVHVAQAVEQVPTILNPSTLVRMLPHGILTAFAPMPRLGDNARSQSHHLGNRMALIDIHYHMNVVARDSPAQNSDPMAQGTDPQPFAVLIPFPAEPEEEPAIVAPMSQVVDETILQIAG